MEEKSMFETITDFKEEWIDTDDLVIIIEELNRELLIRLSNWNIPEMNN